MKRKLMQALKRQHLLWVQRSVMDPELHTCLALDLCCMAPQHHELLEQNAQEIIDLVSGKESTDV